MELLLLLLPFSSFTHLTRSGRLASPRYGDPVPPPGSGPGQPGGDLMGAMLFADSTLSFLATLVLLWARRRSGGPVGGPLNRGALRRLGEVEASEMGRPWWCDMSVVSATKKHWLNGSTTTP